MRTSNRLGTSSLGQANTPTTHSASHPLKLLLLGENCRMAHYFIGSHCWGNIEKGNVSHTYMFLKSQGVLFHLSTRGNTYTTNTIYIGKQRIAEVEGWRVVCFCLGATRKSQQLKGVRAVLSRGVRVYTCSTSAPYV